ncbi:MAG: peptidoglycan-binding domain-containing protein [Candidatus Falkowbacteria bacterium]|nr:peptidoglycan-binding domain-containing protein [Candidatus Falkowbacteria bacterium]
MNKISLIRIIILSSILFLGSSLNMAVASGFVFNKNLALGNVNSEVKELQKYLNTNGFIVAKSGPGSKNKETNNFGPATKNALVKFQKTNKIIPSNGYFGPATRNFVNKKFNKIELSPNTNNLIKTPEANFTISGAVTGITLPITIFINNNEDITINPGESS